MTLRDEIIKILLDKLAIGALLLLAGYLLNRSIERFRSEEAAKNERAKQ